MRVTKRQRFLRRIKSIRPRFFARRCQKCHTDVKGERMWRLSRWAWFGGYCEARC